jgi:ferredoxin
MVNKLQIHYFSGTGNSKNVALVMQASAQTHGIETEIINLATINRLQIKKPDDETLIAFVSPVHGFNYPPVMLHYIFRFPKGNNKGVLMNTRAGLLIGIWVTPGVSGISLYLAALVLKIKGYKIQAMCPVDLPSNWISLHPGLNKRAVDYIYEKKIPELKSTVSKLLAGGRNFKSLREFFIDIILLPIAFVYYVGGRFIIAKTFYATNKCNNCGLCVKNCPVNAIKIVNKHPFWTFNCESCMNCMSNCPKQAIETAHGFIFIAAIIFSLLLTHVVYKFIELPIITNNWFYSFIFENLLLIGFLTLFYRLFHYMLQFKWFNLLAKYTSFTGLKWWRRYKAPLVK